MTGKTEKEKGSMDDSIKVSCPGCEKTYRIPRESLPPGKKVAVTCPNCKTKIELKDLKKDSSPGQVEVDASNNKAVGEYFETGAKVALLACRDPLSLIQIEKELKRLNYEIRDVGTGDELLERFRIFTYPLVILSQRGPDMDPELKRMLVALNRLSPEVRRKTFVVYIFLGGNRFNTLQAFSMGMDLTLSPLDLTNLASILETEMEEKEKLLRPYYEVVKDVVGLVN